jgi:hypothetical protein
MNSKTHFTPAEDVELLTRVIRDDDPGFFAKNEKSRIRYLLKQGSEAKFRAPGSDYHKRQRKNLLQVSFEN